MMHEPTDPTLDEHGQEVHPAFGSITAHRVSTTPGAVLFDSDIRHTQLMRITIAPMTRKRDLHRDWLHASGRPLIEVDLSEAQWASFVSSVNTSGVPCTIRATETNWDIPGLNYEPRLAESMAEVREAASKTFGNIEAAMKAYDELTSKATAKEKREALDRVRRAVMHASTNMAFASRSLVEHAENVVQRARADIEAMVVQHAEQLGIEVSDVGRLVVLGGAPDDHPAEIEG